MPEGLMLNVKYGVTRACVTVKSLSLKGLGAKKSKVTHYTRNGVF